MLTIKLSTLRKWTPLILYHVLFLAILIANFPLGKYFYGWDGLYPELNFPLNVARALSAGWQENYGLGAIGGHGFAATLPHTLITWLLSWILPLSAIRPLFTYLCLYIGGLGIHVLSKQVLSQLVHENHLRLSSFSISLLSIVGSLYFLLNLATTQLFALQLEAFIVHYAALPWIFWSIFNLLSHQTKRNWIIFSLIQFFTSVQGFIPPLFITLLITLFIVFVNYVIHYDFSRNALKKTLLIGIATIAINSYWLLPFSYYALTQQDVYLNSYNNFISTSEFIAKSRSFGNLQNTIFLKSFFWDGFQLGEWMFEPFRQHHQNLLVMGVGYYFFLLILLGFTVGLFWIKSWLLRSFSIAWLFLFSLLTTETLPFGWLTRILQWLSPSFAQSFRIAFTKVSVGVIVLESLLLILGIILLIKTFKYLVKVKILVYVVSGITLFLSVFYAWPVFTGNLLYRGSLVDLPDYYSHLVDFLNKQPPGRVMELPQSCSDGWYSTKWGYIGSGFIWYGLEKPLLSRSADVWSNYSEQYYWELIYALNSENFEFFDKIIKKYRIGWIILDENIIGCLGKSTDKQLEKIKEHLDKSSIYSNIKQFESNQAKVSPLWLYSVKSTDGNIKGIQLFSGLPTVSYDLGFAWEDKAYQERGDYISSLDLSGESRHPAVIYPYPSLFTNRKQDELGFIIEEKESELEISLKNQMNFGQGSYQLVLPNYVSSEHWIITEIWTRIQNDQYQLAITYHMPSVILSDQVQQPKPHQLIELSPEACRQAPCELQIGNQRVLLSFENDAKKLVEMGIKTSIENGFIIQDSTTGQKWIDAILDFEAIKSEFAYEPMAVQSTDDFKIKILKETQHSSQGDLLQSGKFSLQRAAENCKGNQKNGTYTREFSQDQSETILTYSAIQASSCDHFYVEKLPHDQSYLVKLVTKNLKSIPFRVGIQNPNAKRSELDTILSEHQDWFTNWLIVPPQEAWSQGYTVYLDTVSFGREINENQLKNLEIWPIPYNWITGIRIENTEFRIENKEISDLTNLIQVDKKSIWLYKVSLTESQMPANSRLEDDTTLMLSQAYHPGWLAWSKSSGWLDHVKVNNWANGWQVPQSKIVEDTVYIFFWPQLLEFLGFGFLIGAGVWLWRYRN